jgi:hypothetical protein
MASLKLAGWLGVGFMGVMAQATEAHACGGCFVPPNENSQVTGHRMVMSIGMDQSTLYDQIEYSGSPESFAWVLPTRGKVEIGVSSDLLFNQLGFDSAVNVVAPPLDCPAYTCDGPLAEDGFGSTGSGAPSSGGVEVIAQEVVGPYETVQLQASDPAALANWLTDHGYNLPKAIEPTVDSYVKEGFNFLAVKLVPGQGVQSMQPIRITSKGSGVSLPLRMVAAGTGALTTISLYVVSEFRAETQNFPAFTIDPKKVVWNYDLERSNYTDLRAAGYKDSNGQGWLTESAQPYSAIGFRSQIENVISFSPSQSGYGSEYEAAQVSAKEDLDTLFAGMDENAVWLTRLRAELPSEALASDLTLQASAAQVEVPRRIQTTEFVGAQPACPPIPPGCEYAGEVSIGGGSGCSVSPVGKGYAAFGGIASVAAFALLLRRRHAAQR